MNRLSNLSHADFEDLCRDIAQAETGKRFAAFGPGPDGGTDGRHSKGPQATVLQSKHYAGSSFPKLKSALKQELPKIELLNPGRYIFMTSQSLTPQRSDELADILGDFLKGIDNLTPVERSKFNCRKHLRSLDHIGPLHRSGNAKLAECTS